MKIDRYKTYRKLFRKTGLDVETEYFKNKFDYKTNSIKKLWSNLNTVCSASRKKNNKKSSVNALNINGCKIED